MHQPVFSANWILFRSTSAMTTLEQPSDLERAQARRPTVPAPKTRTVEPGWSWRRFEACRITESGSTRAPRVRLTFEGRLMESNHRRESGQRLVCGDRVVTHRNDLHMDHLGRMIDVFAQASITMRERLCTWGRCEISPDQTLYPDVRGMKDVFQIPISNTLRQHAPVVPRSNNTHPSNRPPEYSSAFTMKPRSSEERGLTATELQSRTKVVPPLPTPLAFPTWKSGFDGHFGTGLEMRVFGQG